MRYKMFIRPFIQFLVFRSLSLSLSYSPFLIPLSDAMPADRKKDGVPLHRINNYNKVSVANDMHNSNKPLKQCRTLAFFQLSISCDVLLTLSHLQSAHTQKTNSNNGWFVAVNYSILPITHCMLNYK